MSNNDSLPDAMVEREAKEDRKLSAHDDLVAAMRQIRLTAVDADLRASYHRTALEQIARYASVALAKAGAA